LDRLAIDILRRHVDDSYEIPGIVANTDNTHTGFMSDAYMTRATTDLQNERTKNKYRTVGPSP
jgi:hypothetical protein